ncbi:hypothetical protein HDK90DRAFT_197199 [Phyllosticta capitalensis]|uniref:Uncharacterized protein n=1 Tax=Phyllosticta capitalensis TaxID=121624 RepID=A0ABR1YXI3_9PEZI
MAMAQKVLRCCDAALTHAFTAPTIETLRHVALHISSAQKQKLTLLSNSSTYLSRDHVCLPTLSLTPISPPHPLSHSHSSTTTLLDSSTSQPSQPASQLAFLFSPFLLLAFANRRPLLAQHHLQRPHPALGLSRKVPLERRASRVATAIAITGSSAPGRRAACESWGGSGSGSGRGRGRPPLLDWCCRNGSVRRRWFWCWCWC